MDSVSSMSRERKKSQLKRQIVPSRTPEPEEDGQEAVRRAHRRTVRKRLLIFLVLAILAGAAGVIFWQPHVSLSQVKANFSTSASVLK